MIPHEWQPIGEPCIPELSEDARRVLRYIQKYMPVKHIGHKSIGMLMKALRMGEERVHDAIYEIRKQEAIIMGKLTDDQRETIFRSWKDGVSQAELARQYNVTPVTISRIIKNANRKPQVNENTAAVSEIAETAAPVAESVQEQPAEPEPVITAPEIPKCVRNAVKIRICRIMDELSDLEHRRDELQDRLRDVDAETDRLTREYNALKQWQEAGHAE